MGCFLPAIGALTPFGDLAMRTTTACASLALVAAYTYDDSKRLQRANYPRPGQARWLRYSANVFWFLQSVCLPVIVAIEIARLFAHSTTTLDILFNVLAVT